MKITTHNGKFHGDEIFAIAILKLIYPDVEIIRTRDEKLFLESDLLVDVGHKFDNKKFFDHHQLDFKEKRKNGVPYASAGLIWRKFYDKLTNKDVYDYLDKKIFQFIDADDSGLMAFEAKQCEPYTIGSVIEGMYSKKFDGNFLETLNFIIKLMSNEISRAEKLFEAKKIISEKLKNNNDEFLVLDKYIPWRNWLVGNEKIKFVIYRREESDDWCSVGVFKKLSGFERVAYFPIEWAGLSGKDLEEITKIKSAKFCHKERFICVAETKKQAIELTKLALKKNENKV